MVKTSINKLHYIPLYSILWASPSLMFTLFLHFRMVSEICSELVWHFWGTVSQLVWHLFGTAGDLLLNCWGTVWNCFGTVSELLWDFGGTVGELLGDLFRNFFQHCLDTFLELTKP